MVSPMSEIKRVTEMRDLSTSVRTGGMRECQDHLMLCVIALISSAGTTLTTVLDCWPQCVSIIINMGASVQASVRGRGWPHLLSQ